MLLILTLACANLTPDNTGGGVFKGSCEDIEDFDSCDWDPSCAPQGDRNWALDAPSTDISGIPWGGATFPEYTPYDGYWKVIDFSSASLFEDDDGYWTLEGVELGTGATLEYTVDSSTPPLVITGSAIWGFDVDKTDPGIGSSDIYINTLQLLDIDVQVSDDAYYDLAYTTFLVWSRAVANWGLYTMGHELQVEVDFESCASVEDVKAYTDCDEDADLYEDVCS